MPESLRNLIVCEVLLTYVIFLNGIDTYVPERHRYICTYINIEIVFLPPPGALHHVWRLWVWLFQAIVEALELTNRRGDSLVKL